MLQRRSDTLPLVSGFRLRLRLPPVQLLPPLPYLVGEIFRVFGFSFIAAVKLTAIAQILLSALAMYICAGAIFGSLGGALSALFTLMLPIAI